MRIVGTFLVSANSHVIYDTTDKMNCCTGVKRIAVCASADGILSQADTPASLSVPNASNGIGHYEFPIINGKSPCLFTFYNTTAQPIRISFIVEEYGGIADRAYFNGGVK